MPKRQYTNSGPSGPEYSVLILSALNGLIEIQLDVEERLASTDIVLTPHQARDLGTQILALAEQDRKSAKGTVFGYDFVNDR
jgi:hypothetical protein